MARAEAVHPDRAAASVAPPRNTERPPVVVETPHGPARAYVRAAGGERAALVLGHGAGGGIQAPDLGAAAAAAAADGFGVVLVEQPYRVAGRRAPPRAPQLDAAWTSVLEHLRADELSGLAVIVGGRSSGARVACRTAAATAAIGVLCLAFPLEPPPQRGTAAQSRLPELDAVRLPTLVVQGANDRFGMPPAGPRREVVTVPGDHGLKADLGAVTAAVRDWLPRVVAERAPM